VISVDHVHSETTVTALMVASGRGFFGTVEQLLNMGANVSAVSSNEWTALDWARKFEQHDVVELLETHMYALTCPYESLALFIICMLPWTAALARSKVSTTSFLFFSSIIVETTHFFFSVVTHSAVCLNSCSFFYVTA